MERRPGGRQRRGATDEQYLDAEPVDLYWIARFHAGSLLDHPGLDLAILRLRGLLDALGRIEQITWFNTKWIGEVNDLEIGDPADLSFNFRVSPSAQVPSLQVESCHEHRLR